MTRRRIGLGIILFLLATTAAAPVAFWVSQRGGDADYDADYEESRRPGEFVDMTDAVWDCYQFGDWDGLRTYDRLRECGPGYGKPSRVIEAYLGPAGRPAGKGGPLQLASARAVAQGMPAVDDGIPFIPGGAKMADPIMAALEPAGGGSSPLAGLTGGNPSILIANGVLPDPVPVPGALPLLLTGLAGLGALRHAKGKARKG